MRDECGDMVIIDFDSLWCRLPKGHDGHHQEVCAGIPVTWPNGSVHEDWCHVVIGCTEPDHCTCGADRPRQGEPDGEIATDPGVV